MPPLPLMPPEPAPPEPLIPPVLGTTVLEPPDPPALELEPPEPPLDFPPVPPEERPPSLDEQPSIPRDANSAPAAQIDNRRLVFI